MLDVVPNELSWVETNSPEKARQLIWGFADVLRKLNDTAGRARLRTSPGFDDMSVGRGYSVRSFRTDVTIEQDSQGLKLQRVLRLLATKTPRIDLGDGRSAYDVWAESDALVDPRSGGETAQGILAAHLLDGVSVSLCSSDRWNAPFVELDVSILQGESLVERRHPVRHAAIDAHVDVHADWLKGRDPDPTRGRFRQRVSTEHCTFEPASSYRGGKHVQGSTNAQRHEHACRAEEGGCYNGQFFASLPDGTPVTDEVIGQWERRVISEAMEGQHDIKLHAEAFHIYATMDEPIGYASQSGVETRLMRVEWSSHRVHSHPREP